jgi:5-hydroxyisourate hydrolase
MARLSTHVLDTSTGTPAAGIRIDLHTCGPGRVLCTTTQTNDDGRTVAPLLSGPTLETGVYELTFHAGDYFRARNLPITDPPFLDQIVIRFGISDAHGNYHVPLLLSPYGYSTYRGS